MGSQRGGRGKERGFSLGAVDILVVVVICLEIEESLGCMCWFLVDGMGECGGELTQMMLTFLWFELEHRAFPTSS